MYLYLYQALDTQITPVSKIVVDFGIYFFYLWDGKEHVDFFFFQPLQQLILLFQSLFDPNQNLSVLR